MKINRLFLFLFTYLLALTEAYSQDRIPEPPPLDTPSALIEEAIINRQATAIIDSVPVLLPEYFEAVGINRITDEYETLQPIFERMRLLRLGIASDTLRILHIGDSHVRGRIFPNTTGERLAETFGAINYTDMGVNGATSLTFTHPQRLKAIIECKPDLLIMSFGTNESHNRRYNERVHYGQMDELVKLIQKDLPGVPIILTTPPGSYESFRQKNRRRAYSINPRTEVAVQTINRYAHTHKLAVWDMYNILGGAERACKNWKEAGLMRPDHVHYMPDAYVLQGELLFEALLNTYNKYVAF